MVRLRCKELGWTESQSDVDMPLEIRSSRSKNSNPQKSFSRAWAGQRLHLLNHFQQNCSTHPSTYPWSQRCRLSDADSVIITKSRRIVPMIPSIVALGDTRKKLNKGSPDVKDRNVERGAKVANNHFMLLLFEMLVGLKQGVSPE